MLTQETKRHIDAARQVLVGVVPNPSSQIDQITNALIYKFMDDMDQSAIKAGGDPSFFVGDLERYAWTRLMDSRLGNQERMNLYSEALVKFSEAKQLPPLFRDIFKSAFLPYRSPEVLGLFLKEIDYFDYSHSEELGNAYEYLLSIMGSQGDAGQFRTPRHIIDFIVEAVNPTKDDKVLDPACGTAGFLVSAYKHILEQHDGKNADGSKNNEKPLTPDQRKAIMNNFEGYDVDPGMVRISQVNMYLHHFRNPKIFNYNTLSQDERWADKFDVILANPPFMSPKGGVSTHNKFSVPSSRSEVLFVDYIMNHLRPKGRAGIIVPEGIIFQSGTAHKQLRKNLIEDGLYAVVSLPSGVFQPYSGVKTSILLFNNELAKQNTEILFVKVENDGFDLGATKRPINKNDLPQALEIIDLWKTGKKHEGKLALYVEKAKITESGDYNLSGDRYRTTTDNNGVKWPMFEVDQVVETITPPVKIPKDHFAESGSFPIIDQSQEEISGWTDNANALVKSEKPLVIFGDHTCAVKYTDKPFAQGADGIKILLTNDRLLPKFLYYILKIKPVEAEGYQRHFAILKRHKIPVPSLEIQEQIVAELDGYQKIIFGARQIADSWKPKIDISPDWDLVPISEMGEVESGFGFPLDKQGRKTEKYPFLKVSDMNLPENEVYITKWNNTVSDDDVRDLKLKVFPKGTVIFPKIGAAIATNKKRILSIPSIYDNNVMGIIPKSVLIAEYLYYWMVNFDISTWASESSPPSMRKTVVEQYEIPLPPIEIQKQIVEIIEAERALVEASMKLIEIYEQKTKDVLSKLWAE